MLTPEQAEFVYTVKVQAATKEQADQVMAERLGPLAPYGFEYTVDFAAPGTHVLVVGNPFDGLRLIGPVTPNDPDLDEYVEADLRNDYWWYVDLTDLGAARRGDA